jgi:hypothetical protein
MQYYEQGLNRCGEVRPEILNNIGVLRMEIYAQQGDPDLKGKSL